MRLSWSRARACRQGPGRMRPQTLAAPCRWLTPGCRSADHSRSSGLLTLRVGATRSRPHAPVPARRLLPSWSHGVNLMNLKVAIPTASVRLRRAPPGTGSITALPNSSSTNSRTVAAVDEPISMACVICVEESGTGPLAVGTPINWSTLEINLASSAGRAQPSADGAYLRRIRVATYRTKKRSLSRAAVMSRRIGRGPERRRGGPLTQRTPAGSPRTQGGSALFEASHPVVYLRVPYQVWPTRSSDGALGLPVRRLTTAGQARSLLWLSEDPSRDGAPLADLAATAAGLHVLQACRAQYHAPAMLSRPGQGCEQAEAIFDADARHVASIWRDLRGQHLRAVRSG